MLVEHLENWEVDASNNFELLGVSSLCTGVVGRMTVGDTLIVYVASGLSQFSDVREIVDPTLRDAKNPVVRHYGKPYPYRIVTASKVTLARNRWVSIRPLLPRLSCGQKKHWQYFVRNTFKRLEKSDAEVILSAMQAQRQA